MTAGFRERPSIRTPRAHRCLSAASMSGVIASGFPGVTTMPCTFESSKPRNAWRSPLPSSGIGWRTKFDSTIAYTAGLLREFLPTFRCRSSESPAERIPQCEFVFLWRGNARPGWAGIRSSSRFEDPVARLVVDARTPMQRAVHRADGHAGQLGDLRDSAAFGFHSDLAFVLRLTQMSRSSDSEDRRRGQFVHCTAPHFISPLTYTI